METILMHEEKGRRVFLSSYQFGGSDALQLQGSGVTCPGPGELGMAGMGSAFNNSQLRERLLAAHTPAPVLVNSASTQHHHGISGMGPSMVGRYPGMCQWPRAGDLQDHLEPAARMGISLRRRSHPRGRSCNLAQGKRGGPWEEQLGHPRCCGGYHGRGCSISRGPPWNESRDCFTSRPGAGGV